MKHIYISVTNDLVSDQRVHKVATTLMGMGLNVTLIGRVLKNSLPIKRPYTTKRFKLLFNKGPLFYAEYNIRLFLFLLFKQYDILLANDLDTLAANYLASKIRRKTLVYDSHEYFTGTPELAKRKFVRKLWKIIEQFIFPKLKYVYTVNKSIAELYLNEYNNDNIVIIRNIANKLNIKNKKSRADLNMPTNKKIIILQGAGINIDRGAEELVEAMQFIDGIFLYIIGNGDVIDELKKTVNELSLSQKIMILPKMPYNELMHYTCNADLGLTLDKDTNINYKFSLPNKIFDYIQANIPVLSSNLPELAKIINTYDVGDFILNHTPEHIAQKISYMVSDELKQKHWIENTIRAANELCWENEENKLIALYQKVLKNE